MEKEAKKTLGQAIDETIVALEPLDETARLTAIKAVCEHLKIPFKSQQIDVTESEKLKGTEQPSISPPTDIKTFKELKNPSSANEMAAVVAFFLSELAPETERKLMVETEDMIKYFKQAKFPLPKILKQLLPNAKFAGYFDFVGEGKYKLNPVGYNLVALNLPRSQTKTPSRSLRAKKSKLTKKHK